MDFLHDTGHEKFKFKTLEDLKTKLKELKMELPFSSDYSTLFEPIDLAGRTLPNAFAVQPMEGCDGSTAGNPEPLTYRRYRRFGAGGSGLIWMEATAVKAEGRANPRQLMINEETAKDFKRLLEDTQKAASESMGAEHNPLLIMQLTHSGRYSKPHGKAEPIIAHHSKVLDHKHNLGEDYPLISDAELDALQDNYVKAASLASEMGYEGVDIKACHGYLLNEILGCHTRENSKYGGSFENRTRFILEVVKRIKAENPNLIVGTRLNVYDAMPYPYGFGMATDGSMNPDLTEPIRLIEELIAAGLDILNIAVGNPYYNPHVERPFDRPIKGAYIPKEHPLENIGENMKITRKIKDAVSDKVLTVASGLSWLRQYIPEVAAGLKNENWCDIIGLGRAPFAYPDLVKDLKNDGKLHNNKLCISCSSCTQMMRDGGKAGCPVRDSEIYGPLYKEGRLRAREYAAQLAQQCQDCVPASCKAECPAEIDIPDFIQAIANGEDKKAYQVLRAKNSLPEICAYTCPAEVQCEKGCVQNNIGRGAVPIQQLQRYVSELARKEGWTELNLPKELKDKKVAVVGAGAAGLACAIELLQKGYSVSIYDAREKAGGMAEKVIPSTRLKDEVIVKEIESILSKVPQERLQWEFNHKLGEDISIDQLQKNNDAVFLGLGLHESTKLNLEGKTGEGIFDALEFLAKIKKDPDFALPKKVAVIGGGNTAMDAATQAAKQIGDKGNVYLIYRRSFSEMPAWPAERENALEAGVHFLVLQQPLSYIQEEGKLKGIKVIRTELGELDASGRRSPKAIAGTEQTLEVDMVIEAVGQSLNSDLISKLEEKGINTEKGLIKVSQGETQTSLDSVFAGGDVINGGMTVVQAVKDGIQAANEIEDYLN